MWRGGHVTTHTNFNSSAAVRTIEVTLDDSEETVLFRRREIEFPASGNELVIFEEIDY